MLDEGVYASVSEIGDAENISKSYVSRILRLALLAPDMVEAILAGRTDQALMLETAGAAAAGELGGAAATSGAAGEPGGAAMCPAAKMAVSEFERSSHRNSG